jgi:hypothetical protein
MAYRLTGHHLVLGVAMAHGRALVWRCVLVALVAALVWIGAGPAMAATTTYTGGFWGPIVAAGDKVVLASNTQILDVYPSTGIAVSGTLQFSTWDGYNLRVPRVISGKGAIPWQVYPGDRHWCHS